MRLFGWKSRKYPIKRDEYGRSARQRAFELFWEAKRPAEVRQMLPISMRTTCRYFEDWQKLNDKISYSTIRKWTKERPEFKEKVITMVATSLGMSREEVIIRMQKPWGLMQLMKGAWPNYRIHRQQSEIESRLEGALKLILLAEHLGNDREELENGINKLLSSKRKKTKGH